MLSKKCKLHLEEVNESGLEHMMYAIKSAILLQLLVPTLLVHAFAPRFFIHTASNTITKILRRKK